MISVAKNGKKFTTSKMYISRKSAQILKKHNIYMHNIYIS